MSTVPVQINRGRYNIIEVHGMPFAVHVEPRLIDPSGTERPGVCWTAAPDPGPYWVEVSPEATAGGPLGSGWTLRLVYLVYGGVYRELPLVLVGRASAGAE